MCPAGWGKTNPPRGRLLGGEEGVSATKLMYMITVYDLMDYPQRTFCKYQNACLLQPTSLAKLLPLCRFFFPMLKRIRQYEISAKVIFVRDRDGSLQRHGGVCILGCSFSLRISNLTLHFHSCWEGGKYVEHHF